ncbi:E3 ubiquitin-protein ligase SINA-like 7 isoform X1 [Daucus carota subsp. sativus]|uniref:E3 ubiquitin-protein ligase SINA-like 7 isoform X1 n=1 Tax=Daucus carota subsp. sativus TaxID=79200 RepID=UPI0007F044DE|nr:PREDICTED: E3 ubiquitin-protein ligase SINA-like 7 isoform X1 [Daucus carota subsp. sativus]
MARSLTDENSSSSEDESEYDVDARFPKRRCMPFPSAVLYYRRSNSNPPAIGPSRLRHEGTSSDTPAVATIGTTSAAITGASTSQTESDETPDDTSDDLSTSSASEGEDDQIDDEDDDSEEEEATLSPSPPVTPRPLMMNNPSENLANVVSNDVVPSGSGGRTSEHGPAILTDTDVLDCPICFDAFTSPVYQCDNGHTACASCCGKLRNKCPSCCSSIGYNRCRALEKVLEAVKITCLNSKYGCKEKVSYNMKREHERSCSYEPCCCPHPGCNFEGSYKDIYLHFAGKHSASATRFKFDASFPVHIGANMKYKFLQEHDHSLFILNYGVQTVGNVANIICIGPSSLQNKYSYELEASYADSSVKLTSSTQSQPKWMAGLPQRSFLVVPKCFIDSSGMHKINICIRRKG